MFVILIMTLPSQPNAVRLRIWRALKALGCVALRDGAYLLPQAHSAALEALAVQAQQHGGSGSVWQLAPRDEAQQNELLAQYDRGEAYRVWQRSVRAVRDQIVELGETDARRRVRGVADALQAIDRIDYFPGTAALQAQDELAQLHQLLDQQFSRGEPRALDGDVERLDRKKFQRKRWVTRARPWVDRLASAWLIRAFIDPQARFVWAADPAQTPRGSIGFDFDGARFTHVGARVTFEVLMASFSLDTDARLQPIAAMVRYLDTGGIAVAQAAGLEAVLGGLRALHADDDRLLLAATAVFDALYALPPDTGKLPS